MSLLRKTRTEMAGAWRSLRYDLGRRPAEPETAGPDMTSTGMNTFGGVNLPDADSRGPAGQRPPRRAAAVTMLGALTVAGAAGAYLAVVNGLGSLMTETPAAADTFPPAPPAVSVGVGSAPRPAKPVRTGHKVAPKAPAPGVTAVKPARKPPLPARPVRTAKPTSPDCNCAQPPMPTPTAPGPSVSVTPSTSASTSADPSPSGSTATSSVSAEPSETSDNPPRSFRRWGN